MLHMPSHTFVRIGRWQVSRAEQRLGCLDAIRLRPVCYPSQRHRHRPPSRQLQQQQLSGSALRWLFLVLCASASVPKGHASASWPPDALWQPLEWYLSSVAALQDAAEANVVAHQADLLLSQNCIKAVAPEHNVAMLVYGSAMAGQASG